MILSKRNANKHNSSGPNQSSNEKNKALQKQNFGLSENEYDQLVKQLKQGDHQLFKHIFLTHFDACQKFIKQKYNADYEESYDASMDALIQFRQLMVEGKIRYGNIRFLFTKIAGQILMRNRKNVVASDQIPTNVIDENEYKTSDEDLDILGKAWENLGVNCRKILKMNYYDGMKLNEIAKELGKSDPALRKQKERCKKKLIELFHYHAKEN